MPSYREQYGRPIGADENASSPEPTLTQETRKFSRFIPITERSPLNGDTQLEIHFLDQDGTYQARKIEDFPLAPFKQAGIKELKVIVPRFLNASYIGSTPEDLAQRPLAELAPRGLQFILTLTDDEKNVIAQKVTSPVLDPQRKIRPITEYFDAYIKVEKKTTSFLQGA